MTEHTIYVFAKSGVTITHANGSATNQTDIIGNALNGDAFSWENPHDLTIVMPSTKVAITFSDKDGTLSDDPFAGSNVTDQFLSEPVTINGETFNPSEETVRWKGNPPVNVENEYEVTLYDDSGTAYRMVGISITQGYTTKVVGVMFDGATPPPGTQLHYIQGVSSYSGSGQSMTIPEEVVCFVAGTRIDTPDGQRAVETLVAGDLVLTVDHGPQPLRWVGRSLACGLGRLAPVRIASENGRDLFVSPNHRVLVRSGGVELHFGHPEVLVPAKALIDGVTVREAPMRRAVYYHLLFDRHELVYSEAILTESLFTGAIALSAIGAAAREELETVMPGLATGGQTLCRPTLTPGEAQLLLASTKPGERGIRPGSDLCSMIARATFAHEFSGCLAKNA